ncbi:4-hydroxy-tetrahydrodipicolinate synthase [Clostridium acetobutylicum]|uniref:4-hydroxy-tetrahydrodipicolinate synthase 2 n=1 Tax=Clostridium acetobutylicum (strain ATCC 824 / DSM 792 / JCM 1419 / IAM 19013 / LMG 5710 / NBRC 13948 / NRRL B-527 / VKM B-1787 / 2291 / W) TaxID=272562 RepID=DAPA2_CLOAB|nr:MULTISPECIES: 4-hydroxy-tetrahydrodipicolinate synthase [Clostridium]Q97D80.1 RecName: Full=4-hydroxy-tetrahydrodipicolinate synthase 2; Short=HTPA synthase 2 [Clostridium acetobutylicum ATCC 824]AAK81523.1 Dihydrodipicolinate synthase [Clostridium acetobutylicum ATCC 824]ADZ22644.1 dihydrodipicolinate synthase [Clostridium acetobutylicum EA 2018]AEI33846.1 dihydrodipicolinate synthase [Clostridium acetobutylicum DSM 1731]AWV80804.1 4-hydroxy-tetrahydrodipicolinate synthase [Clostridium ace
MKIEGVLIPLITPFKDGKVDLASYEKLIRHYSKKGVAGFMPLATTGETPTLSDYEYQSILEKTVECNELNLPIYVGFGGNNTEKMTKDIKMLDKYNIKGILSVCPYYNRPDQRGIYEHFKRISESTSLDIVLYNIPYRTGRNIENDTIRRLSELDNIVGVKDACGDFTQTTELLLNRPDNFSILTGEDAFFYSTLMLGGDGGIMASAHLNTEKYVEVFNKSKQNDYKSALEIWKQVANMIPLLFEEPNPAPIKYCLSKTGVIASEALRLPLVPISENLKEKLNKFL